MEGLADSSQHETNDTISSVRQSVGWYASDEVESLLLQVRKECYNKGVSDSLDIVTEEITKAGFIDMVRPYSINQELAHCMVSNIFKNIDRLKT